MINLDKDSEPDIWNAIKRDALLENVTVRADGSIDFADKSVTENTRVSYPIYHIENIVKPVSKGPAAEKVIFLSADAFGVLPPVFDPDPGTDQILLPVRLHRQTGRNRTRHHRTDSDLLGLLRRSLPVAASDQIRGGTGEKKCRLPAQRPIWLTPDGTEPASVFRSRGHPRNHRRDPRRFDRQGSDQKDAVLRLRNSDRAAGRRPEDHSIRATPMRKPRSGMPKPKTWPNVSSRTSKFEGNEAGKKLVAAGPKL